MKNNDWQQLSELFDQLMDLPNADRVEFLQTLKLRDPQLALDLERLFIDSPKSHLFDAPPESLLARALEKQQSNSKGELTPTLITSCNDLDPSSPRPSDKPNQAGRYIIEEEIARGGMGAILRASDPDFHRKLAVKVLLSRAQSNSDAIARFLKEARVTGQLQHPGIPPVHELGYLNDGRPYFAMKLIEGMTFAQLLHSFNKESEQLSELMDIFERICQTMAYAHSQGVIHRDLKPDNVMVGAFGEVQVMDWGLAKEFSSSSSEDSTIAPQEEVSQSQSLPEDHVETVTGSLMGTPSYLAPEQARGEIHDLDERCDVFALGGILCRILTGEPTFVADSVNHRLRMAIDGDVSNAQSRLERCNADPELRRLAHECLSPLKEDRPRHAGVVAERIQQYQIKVQERLKEAELERAAAQARADEERRRRRLSVALLLTFIVLLACTGGFFLWYRTRTDALSENVGRLLESAKTNRKALHRKLRDPQQVREFLSNPQAWRQELNSSLLAWEQAKRLTEGDPFFITEQLQNQLQTVKNNLDLDAKDLHFAIQLDQIRLKSTELVNGVFDPAAPGRKFEVLFERRGWSMKQEVSQQVINEMRQSPLRYILVAALDFWAWGAMTGEPSDKKLASRLLKVARELDPDPWRDSFRQVSIWRDKSSLFNVFESLDAQSQTPQVLINVALLCQYHGKDGTVYLRKALLHTPNDFWLNFSLGYVSSRASEKAAAYRAALALRPDSSLVHNNLGVGLAKLNELQTALIHFKRAVAINPSYAKAHSNLGGLLYELGKKEDGIKHLMRAIEIDSDYAGTHSNLAMALLDTNPQKAIRHYKKAIQLTPKNSKTHADLGLHYLRSRDFDNAIETFRNAVTHVKRNGRLHMFYAIALKQSGKVSEAITQYQQAIKVSPNDPQISFNYGLALLANRDVEKATKLFQQATQLNPAYIGAWVSLGQCYHRLGKFSHAKSALDRAFELGYSKKNSNGKIMLSLIEECRRVQYLQEHEISYPMDRLKLEKGISGKLEQSSPSDYQQEFVKHQRKSYLIRLEANTPYRLDLVTDFPAILRVEQRNYFELGESPVGKISNNSQKVNLRFVPPKSGLYRIVILGSLSRALGNYQLKLTKMLPLESK